VHRRWLSAVAVISALALWAVVPAWASPNERIAVFVVGATPEDHDLAEELGEVIIGQVARAQDAEIAGADELRARMAITGEAEAAACLANRRCLARAGASLGVHRAVSGTVGHAGDRLMLSLEWINLEGATPPRRVVRTVEGGLAEIARASQRAVDALFQTLPADAGGLTIQAPARSRIFVDEVPVGAPPVTLGDVHRGRHAVLIAAEARVPWRGAVDVSPGAVRELRVDEAQMPLRKRWASPTFWSGCGLTAAALGTGIVFGVLSTGEPSGQTRGEIQRSLLEQDRQAGIATAALLTAATAAAITVFMGVHYRDHIWNSGN